METTRQALRTTCPIVYMMFVLPSVLWIYHVNMIIHVIGA